MKRFLLTATVLLSAAIMKADEGMWMLPDLKVQNETAMMELGLQIPVEAIYSADSLSIKDAVVQFGGGCTGEVISSEGLVLTNHHCGYSYIQQHSSVDHDYLTDGFWAMSRQEELPCKGLSVTFIDQILDVTGFVQEQLKQDPDPQGTNYLSPKYLSEVAKRFARQEGMVLPQGYRLELKAFYGGNRYYLFVKKVYTDIRMVGAPPSSIGKFGADTDNWMWPRHTGDFSLFRIYAKPNGEPADYSAVNMPLRVKKHLKISTKGYSEGDFAFVMGFPGTTFRYMISDEVKERMETTNFMRIHVRDARQQLLNKEMQADDATRIHYAAVYARSANYWKNALGMNEGLVSLDVFDAKRAQEQALLQWENAHGDTACAGAYRRIEGIVAQRRQALYHQQAIQEAFVTGMDFMRIPSTTALANALKEKREKRIQQAKDSLISAADKYFQSVPFPRVESDVAKEMMRVYMRYIPAGQRINLTLQDGTSVWLNSGSELEYPALFAGATRQVKLRGTALFDVTGNAERPFIVETYACRVEVLGTRFNVRADEQNDEFSTALFRGSVRVTSRDSLHQQVTLRPNERVLLEEGRLRVEPADDPNEYLWTEGQISIGGCSFEEILARFESCYGVRFDVRLKQLPKVGSIGKIRISDGIEHALSILQRNGDFRYTYDTQTNVITIY